MSDAEQAGDITMVRSVAPRIIGLIGYGGAGKTTVASILRADLGFVGSHIKTPIANMARSLLRDFGIADDMIERYIDGDLKRDVIPEIGKSATYLQQTIGFDWGREKIRSDLWLGLWLLKTDAALAAGQRVVQESVRAVDEVAPIYERKGIIIEVRRPEIDIKPGSHKSEILPCAADAVIDNDGSIDDLRQKVLSLVG